jgi:hypothetical protein
MKKIYFTLGLSALLFGANAQQFKKTTSVLGKSIAAHNNLAGKVNQVASTSSVTIDTLVPSSYLTTGCSGGVSGLTEYLAYSTADSGYAFGNAVAQTFTYNIGTVVTITATTTELAQKYNVGSAAATITNVLVFPGVGSGTVTTTMAHIYGETSHTISATPLGTSSTVPMSAYATAMTATTIAQAYVSYSFATPVAVAANANFYASVTVPAFGGTDKDTMAVLSTQAGCSSNKADSLSWIQTTYVIPTAGTQVQWRAIKDQFGAANNLDLMIFPVIDITSNAGINNYVSKGGLSLYAAYPNPANSAININFSLDKACNVEVEIYDISGKVVKTINNNILANGKNSVSVDVTNLEAGSYIYSINAGGNKMFSRFVVTK